MKKASLVVLPPYQNNRIFNTDDPRLNRDNCLAPFILLREKFLEHGVELNTQDVTPIQGADIVIYNDMPRGKILHNKNAFLIILESPLVVKNSWDEEKLKYFNKVFSWNDDYLIRDNFIKINYTYLFPEEIKIDGKRSKLCALISGNKISNVRNELYSERIRAIRWFEKYHPGDFDLYGVGWDKIALNGILRIIKKVPMLHSLIPFRRYNSYLGPVDNKKETLENYDFSICYENIHGLNGYITEKIFDCFFSGTIPIYWGARNIQDHIPSECFIDRRDFKSTEDVYNYMKSLKDDDLRLFRERIRNFILSERAQAFHVESFAQTIVHSVISK